MIIHIFKVRKLRLKQIKQLVQGHVASKWWSQDLKCWIPEPSWAHKQDMKRQNPLEDQKEQLHTLLQCESIKDITFHGGVFANRSYIGNKGHNTEQVNG